MDGSRGGKVPEHAARFEIALRHRVGAFALDVTFALEAQWTVLFAPSGAGKTTILRMIAGLDGPQQGRVIDTTQAGGAVALLDTEQGVHVPAHRRAIRMVAQRAALFPHLSVRRNVRYGMAAGRPHGLEEIAALCRVAHLLDKMPAQLSGGERQRVALARALAAGDCRLLLLDEPFTGLEGELRDALIGDVTRWAKERGALILLVTHDVREVFAAGAHVLKMSAGRIVAQGAAAEVLGDERERLRRLLG